MTTTAWTHHEKRYPRRTIRRSPYIEGKGSGSTITDHPQTVQIKHVLGFTRTDWGEANWTAKDMR